MSEAGDGPTAGRWVLLGLAPPRAPWFREVARWASSASLAAEFVKCLSAEEVRARLRSGRPHSALLVDTSAHAFDRDLVDTASTAGTPVIAVRGPRSAGRGGDDLGVAATLPFDFALDDLVAVLSAEARKLGTGDALPPVLADEPTSPWRGRLVAVCGPGGTGASTVATALAQGLAGDVRYGSRVLLADLALRADQAMLHDAPDLGPGLQELVEAHRLGRPGPEEVRGYALEVPSRRYQLLLGLRRPAAWSVLRPRAVEVTVDSLRATWLMVVADITGDFEGEDDGGSADVAERNHLARSTVAGADAVLAVGAPGVKGIHSLAQLLRALVGQEGLARRVVPVVNRAPRHPRARSEIAAALAELVGDAQVPGPVFVPERKLEDSLRDTTPLPEVICRITTAAALGVIARHGERASARHPERIVPGSLGHWSEQDADAS